MKRAIRFKEPETEIDIFQRPSELYMKKCNQSLILDNYRFRTDSNGAILTGNELREGQAKGYDIVIFGDSFVESSFVHEHERFASILERMLQLRHRVATYGYSGTTTLQVLLSALVKLPIIHPAKKNPKIFACIGTSDVDALFLKNGYWSNSKRYSPIVPALALEELDETFNVDFFFPVLKTYYEFFKNFHYELILVSSPFVTFDNPDGKQFLTQYYGNKDKADDTINKRRMLYSLLVDFVSSVNVDFVDVHKELGGNIEYFYDDRHVNTVGSHKVAEIMFKYLQNR